MTMPLGRGILEVFEAIPDRIEVSGEAPTWKITGGSFEGVLRYAREALGEIAVLGREDRTRWWPRVTLTVTTDPGLIAKAPPPEAFAESDPTAEPAPGNLAEPAARPTGDDSFVSPLEEIFAHQEELRMARRRIPEQRPSS
jgi:hypothetical protein